MDVPREIDATRRTVGAREQGGTSEARLVTVSRVYPTDVADLWDACTDPERIARWFAPVRGDLRLGGHYQLEGQAGGTITACDAPRAFDATWEFAGAVSAIEVRISPEGDGARFTLTHVADVASMDEEFWLTYGPGATGLGWDLGLLGLGMHLAAPRAPRPDAEEWSASASGRAFIQAAGTAWERASVEGGLDPEQARAMAARTVAFFTGTPAPSEV